MRRPPFGPVGPGAHDMTREYAVLSRLWESLPTAPRAFLLCEDLEVLGATFFVMERRTGVVVRNQIPEEMRHHAEAPRRVSLALVDAMAALHDVDFEKAGLGDLGRPAGFVERQLSGWKKRFELAKDVEIPIFDEVHARLVVSQPEPGAPSSIPPIRIA